ISIASRSRRTTGGGSLDFLRCLFADHFVLSWFHSFRNLSSILNSICLAYFAAAAAAGCFGGGAAGALAASCLHLIRVTMPMTIVRAPPSIHHQSTGITSIG